MNKNKETDNLEEVEDLEEEDSDSSDSSDRLAATLGWDRPDNKEPVVLAFAGENERKRPSPFGTAPAAEVKPAAEPEKKPETQPQSEPAKSPEPNPQRDAARPEQGQMPRAQDQALKSPEVPFARELPAGVIDSTQRAFEALKEVKPGQALSAELKAKFENAVKDAAKLDSKWATGEEQKLNDALQSKERKLPNGTVLPPWTSEKEKNFTSLIAGTNKAFASMPEEFQQKVARTNALMEQLPVGDARRSVFQRMLAEEAVKEPKVRDYLLSKAELDKFTNENAAGLVRRHMHQQELSVLHAKGISSGFYALALDMSGEQQPDKKVENLLNDAVNDKFAMANFPEFQALAEKYKVEQKELDELEKKVPGRADLRMAMEIMNDPGQGSTAQRLEKARPFFEKAIGASDQINLKSTVEEIEKIAKERNQLGENAPQDKVDELEKKAVELVEKARMPYAARLSFAMALNNAAAENKDPELSQKAFALLKAAERLDPANELDPVIQGALILAQKNPPEAFDEEKAMEVGKPEVERRKEEMIKAGQKPDDVPAWQKALVFVGQTVAGIAAFHLIGKYVFTPIGNVKNHVRRSWEHSSRVKSVAVEEASSLKPGEQPRLMYKDKDGREMPVEGVRKSDGKLRVWNGESTETVKLGRKDSLVLQVPPESSLTAEQAKEIAGKKLAPVADDAVINEIRERFQQELAAKNLEIEQLKKAQAELQSQTERGPSSAEPASRELFEKMPERLKKQSPDRFNADVKDVLQEVLESNRSKWNSAYVAEMEKLIKDYSAGDSAALERVNKMIAEGRTVAQNQAANQSSGPSPTSAGERPSTERASAGEHAERFSTPELAQDRLASEQRAIETITSHDGIRYIESIPVGELSVARVEEKLKDIDKEIKRVREAGMHEYASELEKIKREYENKKTPAEKEAYCKEVMNRMREAHETARTGAKGRVAGLAGKAGTAVALLMVAGWVLDVTAPPAVARPSGPRVVPGKRD